MVDFLKTINDEFCSHYYRKGVLAFFPKPVTYDKEER